MKRDIEIIAIIIITVITLAYIVGCTVQTIENVIELSGAMVPIAPTLSKPTPETCELTDGVEWDGTTKVYLNEFSITSVGSITQRHATRPRPPRLSGLCRMRSWSFFVGFVSVVSLFRLFHCFGFKA